MNKITIAIFLLFASIPTFATGKKINVKKVEIKKYSYNVHMSASYYCNKYDDIFEDMIVREVKTLDTTISDNKIIVGLLKAFNRLGQKEADRCNGNPQIKIIFHCQGNQKVYFLQDYGYVTNLDGKPILNDEWSINFLKSLGAFK